MRGAYETPEMPCPYCGTMTSAEFCDVGVGMVQVAPYCCYGCGAREAGPYDGDPYDGDDLLAAMDNKTGWYPPDNPNAVDAITALRAERDAYRATLLDIAAVRHPDAVRSPHQEMARECVQKWETGK